MLLYLSSYKLGNKIDILKNWIKEHGNKIILIANSRDWSPDTPEKEESIIRDVLSLKEIGFDVKRIDLREYFEKEEKLKKDLKDYFALNPYNKNAVLYDGLNILNFVPVPHYKSEHPESKLVDEAVALFDKKKIKYKTLRDGEVIVKNIELERK